MRKLARAEDEKLIRPMNPERFHLLSIGVRMAASRMIHGEISYWSDEREQLLGLVSVDFEDEDFAWIILARDRIGRFRACRVEGNIASQPLATEMLLREMADLVRNGIPPDFGWQGDEPNAPFDLLSVTHDSKLHPYFEIVQDDAGHMPAKEALKAIGPWLAPSDLHFVREFQTTAFDQRIWELYLWAAFRELGFDVKQPEAPDFACSAPGIRFTVEATTASPSAGGALAKHPNPRTKEEHAEFLKHYMPMKFGSALTSKLNKKNAAGQPYWDRPETKDRPFLIAVADFHKPGEKGEVGSMTYSHGALWSYLYGKRVEFIPQETGGYWQLVKGETHVFGAKEVPTGFFDLPGAENISAVLFSNAGTLPKFNRMGLRAGFVPKDHLYFRQGYRYDPSPDAFVGIPFMDDVLSPNYEEYWSDELQIFHNPNARNPIAPEAFGGITQYFFKDGDLHTITPHNAVIASMTLVMRMVGDEEFEAAKEAQETK
ncbi:hypothetical protein [Rhizobium leguminosarum]|uniref:hypothetical protein n=2 Tax=Rhizobium leguminosarum TaxID=384 RepID=UPI001FDEFD3D|nr:hypothetical protein [Rhizobium leguminosarum]